MQKSPYKRYFVYLLRQLALPPRRLPTPTRMACRATNAAIPHPRQLRIAYVPC